MYHQVLYAYYKPKLNNTLDKSSSSSNLDLGYNTIFCLDIIFLDQFKMYAF